MENIIWQYWETKDYKPLFVDGLHEIAKKNSGVKVIQVTPETLKHYIPDLPKEIFEIHVMAHKADMIRSLLIYHHGGMWLDSDAIVLSDLNWLFDMLSDYEFVGFNNKGSLHDSPLNVRINCFLSHPGSIILKSWLKSQHEKFPQTEYTWTEIGTDLLDPIILEHQTSVKLLNFDLICPIKWNEVHRFSSKSENSRRIINEAHVVMLSNSSLQRGNKKIIHTPLQELSEEDTLIADIIKKAINSNYEPPG